MSEGVTGKENSSCGLRLTQVGGSQFSRAVWRASGVGGKFTGIPRKQGITPTIAPALMALVSGVMKMLALYFGTDNVTFTVTSNNPNANPNSKTYAQ